MKFRVFVISVRVLSGLGSKSRTTKKHEAKQTHTKYKI